MKEQQPFVEGKKEDSHENLIKRRTFLRSSLATVTAGLFAPQLVFGESPITSPLTRILSKDGSPAYSQDRNKPVQTPEKSPFPFMIERSDLLSIEAKLRNCIAGYEFANKEEKAEIQKRVFTHELGAVIYFTKKTERYVGQNAGRKELFDTLSETNISCPLDQTRFIVVDHDGYDTDMYVAETQMSQIPPITYQAHDTLKRYPTFDRINNLTKIEWALWQDNEVFPLVTHPNIAHPVAVSITVARYRPEWSEKAQRVVFTNGILTMGFYDKMDKKGYFDKMDEKPLGLKKRYPSVIFPVVTEQKCENYVVPKEKQLKYYLADALRVIPELFTDPHEVAQYIKTGNKEELRYLTLMPQDDPYFFVVKEGKNGYHHPTLVDSLGEAIEQLRSIDPKILDQLHEFGVYGFTTGLYSDYHNFDTLCKGFAATFDWDWGVIIDNEKIRSARAPRMSRESKITDFITTILVESSHVDYRRKASFVDNYFRKCGSDGGVEKGIFLIDYAKRYKKRMSAGLYDSLYSYGLQTIDDYQIYLQNER